MAEPAPNIILFDPQYPYRVIDDLIRELGYEIEVADTFRRFIDSFRDDKDMPLLKRCYTQLDSGRKAFDQKRINDKDLQKIETDILIQMVLSIQQSMKYHVHHFNLPMATQFKSANCYAFSELLYIAGNAIGLKTSLLYVRETIKREKFLSHAASLFELSDGQKVMVDSIYGFISETFFIQRIYVKKGSYWTLSECYIDYHVHRRFREVGVRQWRATRDINLGQLLMADETVKPSHAELKAALASFNLAIKIDPGEALFYLIRARCYLELNELDKAIADMKLALEVDPESSDRIRDMQSLYCRESGAKLQVVADSPSDIS